MKTGFGKALGCALVAYLAATSVQASRVPAAEFSCQVRDGSGLSRLLNVQADTLERARIVAAESRRYGPDAASAPLLTVVECIDSGARSFKDPAFRKQLSSEAL